MRNIASRITLARLVGLTTIAAVSGATALAASAPVAAAATATVSAPTLAVSFTPAEIGVTESSGITYTITNPNASGTLYNIAFVDTLPTFTSIDNPTGLTSSGCGSVDSIGAGAGNGGVGTTGITVKAGTPCTISVSVVGNGIGAGADTLGPLTYSTSATGAPKTAPTTSETPATLTVLAPPTVSITGPKNKARYTYGEKVKATYTCTAPDDANGTTLSACLGSDDLGNPVNSGGDIQTTVPGVHSLDVQALDNDGDSADAEVTYTVLPDNIIAIKTAKTAKHGGVKLALKVPGAGTLKFTETHGRTTVASKTETVTGAHAALSVSLSPTAAGKKLLKADKKVKVTLAITYTPKGGEAHKITKSVTLS